MLYKTELPKLRARAQELHTFLTAAKIVAPAPPEPKTKLHHEAASLAGYIQTLESLRGSAINSVLPPAAGKTGSATITSLGGNQISHAEFQKLSPYEQRDFCLDSGTYDRNKKSEALKPGDALSMEEFNNLTSSLKMRFIKAGGTLFDSKPK